jgi:2-polyprenyl-3-methyl-5-hydroxy-6-metoxy-1,4-benzoquinol methylase
MLNLDKESFKGKNFCDVGCGDGRNLVLAKKCGFEIYGVEITQEIVEKVKLNLQNAEINAFDIKVGANDDIPFANELFDYLLSWEASYYMMDERNDYNEVLFLMAVKI